MPSHYLPAFTRQLGRKQQAACSLYIFAHEHSSEPECSTCAAFLVQEAETDAAMERTAAAMENPLGLPLGEP
jgi:hypothetical protein